MAITPQLPIPRPCDCPPSAPTSGIRPCGWWHPRVRAAQTQDRHRLHQHSLAAGTDGAQPMLL